MGCGVVPAQAVPQVTPPSASREPPLACYRERLELRTQACSVSVAKVEKISRWRLYSFALALLLLALAFETPVPAWAPIIPLVLFVVLVIAHELAHRDVRRLHRAVEHYEAGLRRLDGSWPGTGIQGESFCPKNHPYATDLDLFGSGSMFERLCTARTTTGQQTLAAWLLEGASHLEVQARQAGAEELRERLQLREDLALAGDTLATQTSPDRLIAWGAADPKITPAAATRLRTLGIVLPVLLTTTVLGWILGVLSFVPCALAAFATWVVYRRAKSFLQAVELGLEQSRHELGLLTQTLARLEREPFTSPRLQQLQTELAQGAQSASAAIGKLGTLASWLEAQRAQLIGVALQGFFWSVHFSLAIERWRGIHGGQIERWFRALGELEALCALSAYAFEQPSYVFPEVHGGPLEIVATDLGHPLLPAKQCVTNAVQLHLKRPALVVSGSNMSGKSTYLRCVGLNAVLALAGAPVRACHLRMSTLRIGATLRVVDSLQEGASRFYAEILRLKQVTELAAEAPTLFLLDEILHGTNSHDRRIGAAAILQSLVSAQAIGLVTTHDLALAADVETTGGTVDNVHFCDELQDGRLVFDYKMRAGVVRSSNAVELMRSVGLNV